MRWIVSLLPAVLLAGCGGMQNDEVTVRVNGSPAQVLAPLTLASIAEVDAIVPGLKVVKSRPSENELLFTFPGDGKQDPAILHFTFSPTADREATDVRAEVSVPLVTMIVGGEPKVLSAGLIAAKLGESLEAMNKSGRDSATRELSTMLLAMALSTDAEKREKALAIAALPSTKLGELLGAEGEDQGDYAASDSNDPTEFDTPGEANDPTRFDTQYEENDPTEFDTPNEY